MAPPANLTLRRKESDSTPQSPDNPHGIHDNNNSNINKNNNNTAYFSTGRGEGGDSGKEEPPIHSGGGGGISIRKNQSAAGAILAAAAAISDNTQDTDNDDNDKQPKRRSILRGRPKRKRTSALLLDKQQQQQQGTSDNKIVPDNPGAGGGKVSYLWTFLIAGLIVCVMDSIYICNYLLRQEQESQESDTFGNGGTSGEKGPFAFLLNRKNKLFPNSKQQGAFTAAGAYSQKAKDTSGMGEKDRARILSSIMNDPERAPIIQLLKDARIDFNDIEPEKLAQIPKWSDVTDLYGHQPVVLGLETCHKFQNQPGDDPADHFVTTAGTFNSGTNLMAELLIRNCHMPLRMQKYGKKSKGVRWEAVWGKHTPVFNETFRRTHRVEGYTEADVLYSVMLPAVTVRDPFKWIPAMCRHEYGARWPHTKSHCPNLIPKDIDFIRAKWLKEHAPGHAVDPDDYLINISDSGSIKVKVHYSDFVITHDSMVHFWNEWYQQYLDARWPRLMVRMEDVIFYPKQVTQTVCECAGGKLHNGNPDDPRHPFLYVTQSAKRGDQAHGDPSKRTTYIDAIIKYGTEEGRYTPYTPEDLKYVQEYLDPRVMKAFGYKYAPSNSIFTSTTNASLSGDAAAEEEVVVPGGKWMQEQQQQQHQKGQKIGWKEGDDDVVIDDDDDEHANHNKKLEERSKKKWNENGMEKNQKENDDKDDENDTDKDTERQKDGKDADDPEASANGRDNNNNNNEQADDAHPVQDDVAKSIEKIKQEKENEKKLGNISGGDDDEEDDEEEEDSGDSNKENAMMLQGVFDDKQGSGEEKASGEGGDDNPENFAQGNLDDDDKNAGEIQ